MTVLSVEKEVTLSIPYLLVREKTKNQNTPPLKIPHPLQNTRALPLSVPARNRRAEKQKGLSLKQPPHEHILPATKSEATCCDFELLEYFVWLRKTSLTIFLDAQRPIPLGLILQVTKLFFFFFATLHVMRDFSS